MSETKEYIKGDKNVFQQGSVQVKFVQMNFPGNKEEWKREQEDIEKEFEYADFEEVEHNSSKDNPNQQETVSFVDRVKAIIKKAATKNNQKVVSKAKGHHSEYLYWINEKSFCKAIDTLEKNHSTKLLEFLGGNINNVQVSKVCLFIGAVIRENVINNDTLQLVDIEFAFTEFYGNKSTVHSKLGQKKLTADEKVLIGIFVGIVKSLNKSE